ncbi:STAS domain-containing protein [Allochromatium tepidum]|uniref:Anti-sigma factor antagonist n=1 Tax=Allochromatium tepidum TaxID=553982 RepID=A0ABN6GB02_9GAMM|nr:STAS domain-containing protein [Allochromatium tepidum]BCU07088.1 anti-sigma factor antagonist [Allochromatium tepidum]
MQPLLSIIEEPLDDIIGIRLIGRLDSSNAGELEAILPERVAGNEKVLLDCSRLEFISSAGLRIVLMAAKKAKQRDGRFALCGMDENIHGVFETSGFLRILRVYPDRDTAIASMRS